jgi:curli biogenesis system outer membrane secretion channel CsgG
MKNCIALFIILILTGCTVIEKIHDVNVDNDFPHQEIQKIAVMAFEVHSQDKDKTEHSFSKSIVSLNAGTTLSDIVARELARWGRYVVLDTKAFRESLRLMDLKEKDVLRKEDYSELGRSLGVDAVIIGNIEEFGVSHRALFHTLVDPLAANVSLLVKCIDVVTNKEVWSFEVNGSSTEDDERILASSLVESAVKKLKEEIH